MNETRRVRIKVHQVGLRRKRATYELVVRSDTPLKALYGIIADIANPDNARSIIHIAATLEAYDPSRIGRFHYPGRIFTSDYPDETARFKLDRSDSSKSIIECGITDGAELMYNNGEMD